jgi:hypothetical protein
MIFHIICTRWKRKKMMIVHKTSNRRRRFLWLNVHCNYLLFILILDLFWIVSHSSWSSRFWMLMLCRVRIIDCDRVFWLWSRNDQVFLSNVLKTTKFFCQMFSKRSSFLRSNFLNFFLRLRFLFHAQLVHSKVTLSNDRKYYRQRTWWWSMKMINEWCD